MYQDRGKDSISNLYSIKIANKTTNEIPLTIKLENETGTIEIVGKPYVTVVKEGQGAGTFFVVLPKKNIKATKNEITLGLYEGDKKIMEEETSFLGYTE